MSCIFTRDAAQPSLSNIPGPGDHHLKNESYIQANMPLSHNSASGVALLNADTIVKRFSINSMIDGLTTDRVVRYCCQT